MSLKIHVCKDEDEAKLILKSQRKLLSDENLNGDILDIPDIFIYDYSAGVEHPTLANQNKICLVFQDN